MLDELRAGMRTAGRDASSLMVNVVATVDVRPQPIQGKRLFFTGSVEQIREDIAHARALGRPS
jgi:hypothetical protein